MSCLSKLSFRLVSNQSASSIVAARGCAAGILEKVDCYCPPHSFTDYAYAIANQTRALPKFLSTLCKSGPSPTQNLGQVSLGRAQVFRVHTSMGQAQVFENLGRAWASLCSVDTAIDNSLTFKQRDDDSNYGDGV